MPIANTGLRSRLAVVASAIVLASAALPASAGSRAPIVYASDKGAQAPAKVSRPSTPAITADKATQRIEFRYPGSAEGPGRVEMASLSIPEPAGPLAASALTEVPQFAPKVSPLDAAATATRVVASRAPVVEAAPLSPVLAPKPVQAKPVQAKADSQPGFGETAIAIVYGDEFAGLPTANGEIFDQSALTAAHPSLPLPSLLQVYNPATGREVTVRVNDRGPFEDGASLQVSRQVAVMLGFDGAGQAELKIRPANTAAPVAAKPRSALTPALIPAAGRPAASDELLGGDELAGGAGWSASPGTGSKPRVAVQWPEPPADWDVAPAAAKVSAASTGGHFVQLASFSDIGNAETLYRGLRTDLPVEIVPARVNGADFFRVRVGPLASRETALELRDRLDAEGKGDGRVVTAE